jgi:hypothetical protein
MTYTPNFGDPRIQARCTKVLNFVELYITTNKTAWIARQEFYKHFGNTSRPLGKYLKHTILDTTDNWFNQATGECKKYRLNIAGLNHVKTLAGLEQFVPTIDTELDQQLTTGDFEYSAKSDRLYNPIQNITRRIRQPLLANRGYRYNYDIEAAAPTVLLQRAQQIDPDVNFPALENYVLNRSVVRQQLAKSCEISQTQVKFVINAMLQGAVISCYEHGKIFQELHSDYDAVKRLQHNDQIQAIKQDIRVLWSILRQDLPERHITLKSGKTRRARLNGRDKSGYYRAIESQVGKVIQKALRKHKIKFLWIHDGWACDGIIDPRALETQVRRSTGYTIKIDYEVFGDE